MKTHALLTQLEHRRRTAELVRSGASSRTSRLELAGMLLATLKDLDTVMARLRDVLPEFDDIDYAALKKTGGYAAEMRAYRTLREIEARQ